MQNFLHLVTMEQHRFLNDFLVPEHLTLRRHLSALHRRKKPIEKLNLTTVINTIKIDNFKESLKILIETKNGQTKINKMKVNCLALIKKKYE